MALTKAVIVDLDSPGAPPLPVMFNPPNYELAKSNQFAEIKVPGLPSSVLQFVNGNAGTLTMALFFDTSDSGLDVRSRTVALARLAEPHPVTRAPPRLLLLWGSLVFPCFLVSLRQEFDRFDSRGAPLRARLHLEFKGRETLDTLAAAAPPLAAAAQVTAYVTRAGDSLQAIAAKVYQDPARWRDIARANAIDDVRSLAAGVRLQLPQLPPLG